MQKIFYNFGKIFLINLREELPKSTSSCQRRKEIMTEIQFVILVIPKLTRNLPLGYRTKSLLAYVNNLIRFLINYEINMQNFLVQQSNYKFNSTSSIKLSDKQLHRR